MQVDEVTERRWRTAQPSFDGVTVYTDLLPTPLLLSAFDAVLDVVECHTACRDFRTFADWHEHDGYITQGAAGTGEDFNLRASAS